MVRGVLGQEAPLCRGDELLERLGERVVGEKCLLVAVPVQHPGSTLCRLRGESRRKCRLPCAGLAGDQHRSGVAR